MRYRIQVTIGAGHLADVITAACHDNPDPQLKVDAVSDDPGLASAAAAFVRARAATSKARKGTIPKAKSVGGERMTAKGRARAEVVENCLRTGPKRWKEMRDAIGEAGLPQGTINSLISKWQTAGKIQRTPDGLWSLTNVGRTVQEEAAPAHA